MRSGFRSKRKAMSIKHVVYAKYPAHEILPMLKFGATPKAFKFGKHTKNVNVRVSSLRYEIFKRDRCRCVSCGLVGNVFLLEQPKKDHVIGNAPSLNLYAETKDGFILMTQDHIHPRSMGGLDKKHNLQTMCQPCNVRKGNKVFSVNEPVLLDFIEYCRSRPHKAFLPVMGEWLGEILRNEVRRVYTEFSFPITYPLWYLKKELF
jgi:hypothetical protein